MAILYSANHILYCYCTSTFLCDQTNQSESHEQAHGDGPDLKGIHNYLTFLFEVNQNI